MTKLSFPSDFNWHDFIAGWLGGVAGLTVGHPADTIKVRQQTYGTTLWPAISRTYRHEGFGGFFKGMLFPLVTTGPVNSIFFGFYGNSLQYLQDTPHTRVRTDDPRWQQKVFYAGCIGGLATVVFTCPIELVKVVLQANTEGKGSWTLGKKVHIDRSMTKCIKTIYRRSGFLGFYRGFTPMLWRDVPSYGVYTWAYEACLHYVFYPGSMNDVGRQIFSGGTAGILAWSMCMPFDLIKSRMQVDHAKNGLYTGMLDCAYKSLRADGPGIFGVLSWIFCIPFDVVKSRMQADLWNRHYSGMVDCFRKLYNYSGIRVFNTGLVITCLRAFPVNAAIFLVYENAYNFLEDYCVVSWVMCMPFDLVKTRLQADDPLHPVYKGMMHCVNKIYRNEGVLIFNKGITITCIRAFPTQAVLFVVYEFTLDKLDSYD